MSEQDYEQLTLFPADSPASRFPWQESKKEKGMIVTYGLRCSELSESCARIALSVRTFLVSSGLPPGKWSRIWSRQGITSSCSVLKLRLSGLGTGEQGCSLLLTTPNTMDKMPPKSEEALVGACWAGLAVQSLPQSGTAKRERSFPSLRRSWMEGLNK